MRLSALVLAPLLCASCEKAAGPAGGRLPVAKTKLGVEMVLVPAGEFRMGSDRGNDDERPVHAVRLDAFWMDRCEVTQAEYEHLGFPNPSRCKGPDLPVEMMTWTKAALCANARSRAEGLTPCYDEDTARCDFDAGGYRLPTEAEWEYACRAGTDGEYGFGGDPGRLGEHAWYGGNAAKKTHPVGRKKANRWNLFDMHGNVAEWCNDVYEKDCYATAPAENPRGPADGSRYVVRGGAWSSSAEACRSAARAAENPGFVDACLAPDTLGFRLVRTAADAGGERTAAK